MAKSKLPTTINTLQLTPSRGSLTHAVLPCGLETDFEVLA